jgi:hypothetical protein
MRRSAARSTCAAAARARAVRAGRRTQPAFAHPLVCPSLLPPLEPNDEVAGLPAWRPEGDEPWLYDARLRLQPQSDRRRR